MDQLLRLNEETLKWHVLCQLLSSSVLERLLKTLYEVCPSFNADTPVVARLYHETEQACLDVVKNFILIGEANRLLQGGSSSPGPAGNSGQNTPVKPRPVAEAQPMRRLAPKPLNQIFKSDVALPKQVDNGDNKQPNPAWVNQINQNIQLQLKQLNSQVPQSSPSSSRVGTPSSTSPGPLSQLPASNGPISQLPGSGSPMSQLPIYTSNSFTATTVTSPGTISMTMVQPNKEDKSEKEPSPAAAPNGSPPSQTGTGKPGEVQKFEKQVSELKNYMDEVKALFDVFNDQSPKNKEAVNALSQAISVNSAVTQELHSMIKTEPEPHTVTTQIVTPVPTVPTVPTVPVVPTVPAVSHYFPIEQLLKQELEATVSKQSQPSPPVVTTHHKRSSKEKLNCKDCGQMFQYSYQMERHIATRHSYIKKIICDICKKTFGSPGALKRHHETIHQKIKRFTCEHCGKKFGRKDHMKFHISTVHTQKKETVIDHSILDAAITNAAASNTTEVKKPDDPLDELKQRIRDMSENHARELNLQQQLQQQQLHQQQLQQHILAQQQQQQAQQQQQQQQQQSFDLQNVINTINQEILKNTITGPSIQLNGSVPSSSPSLTNGTAEESVDIEMEEDSVQVDVMEDSSDPSNTYNTSQYNTEVVLSESASSVSPSVATHVTVT